MAVFLWAWCLMAKAPRQLVVTSPQFEPLTLGPLRYRNDATSREQAISKPGRARIIKVRNRRHVYDYSSQTAFEKISG